MKTNKVVRRNVDKTILAAHHEAIGLGIKPTAPNPDAIEPGIRDVTMFLWESGFWTFSACGGHDDRLPFIRIHAMPGVSIDETRQSVVACLLDAGFRGFSARSETRHGKNHPAQVSPLDSVVYIEFCPSLPIAPFSQKELKECLDWEYDRVKRNAARKERETVKRKAKAEEKARFKRLVQS